MTVITKFRETLLFCLNGFIALIYTLKPPSAAPPFLISAPWWTSTSASSSSLAFFSGTEVRGKPAGFSFTRFSILRFVALCMRRSCCGAASLKMAAESPEGEG